MKRILCVIVLVLVCVACSTTKPVVVQATHEEIKVQQHHELTQKYDSISRDHTRYVWMVPGRERDTVYIMDSTHVEHWRATTDSIVSKDSTATADTIPQIIEVQPANSQFLVRSGIALWVIIAIILLAVAAGIFIKFAK